MQYDQVTEMKMLLLLLVSSITQVRSLSCYQCSSNLSYFQGLLFSINDGYITQLQHDVIINAHQCVKTALLFSVAINWTLSGRGEGGGGVLEQCCKNN